MAGIEGTTTHLGSKVIRVFREDNSLFQKKVMKKDGTIFLSEFNAGKPTVVTKVIDNKMALVQDVFTKKLPDGGSETTLNTYNLGFRKSNPVGDKEFAKSKIKVTTRDNKGNVVSSKSTSHENYVYVTQNGASNSVPIYTDTISVQNINGKKVTSVRRDENL